MTLLPPSVPALATSPTTMPRASSFWRSACLPWPTSSPKGLTCQGWLWCDRYLSKTSHLWSRRWQSRETTSVRWTRFLPKMTWTRCWSTTTSAQGATSATWTWYWKTSPEQVRKVRMRSSSGLYQWYPDTSIQVSTIPRTEYQWHPKPNINDALIPVSKHQWSPEPSINDTQNRVSMIPQAEYQWYPDTNIRASTIPRTKYQWYPDTSIQVSTIPRTEYQWHRDTSIQASTIPRTEYQSFTEQATTDKSFHPEFF